MSKLEFEIREGTPGWIKTKVCPICNGGLLIDGNATTKFLRCLKGCDLPKGSRYSLVRVKSLLQWLYENKSDKLVIKKLESELDGFSFK